MWSLLLGPHIVVTRVARDLPPQLQWCQKTVEGPVLCHVQPDALAALVLDVFTPEDEIL